MKDCWSEGDLRAYLDRELAPEEMERATAHLAECPDCRRLSETLSARAVLISDWMNALAEPAAPEVPAPRARRSWRWVAASLAAAAAVILAVALTRRGEAPPAPVTQVEAPRVVHPAEEPAIPVREAAVLPQRPRVVPVRRPAERTETFVALDNEPFEAGWVVRMALGPDQIQADVVFSADGRARAYRLVGESSN